MYWIEYHIQPKDDRIVQVELWDGQVKAKQEMGIAKPNETAILQAEYDSKYSPVDCIKRKLEVWDQIVAEVCFEAIRSKIENPVTEASEKVSTNGTVTSND